MGGTISNIVGLATTTSTFSLANSQGWTSGTGAQQADRLYTATRTIAASGTDPLDLAGVLTDGIGTTITFARVKAMYIAASGGNTNNVIVGGGTNPFVNWVGAGTHTVTVRPGGLLLLTAPDATAYVVTPATGDILQLANSGAGTTVTYTIAIYGSSA
jgi:hypothetical protein